MNRLAQENSSGVGSHFAFRSEKLQKNYEVVETYCADPDCPCNCVYLEFYDKSEEPAKIAFEAELSLETWTALRDPDLNAAEQVAAEEFVEWLSDERKRHFISKYEEGKILTEARIEELKETVPLDPSGMIPYSQVFAKEGSILDEGGGVGFDFIADSVIYGIEDVYCLNPKCECNNVLVAIFVRKEESNEFQHVCEILVDLDTGKTRIEELLSGSRKQAREISRDWINSDPELLTTLKSRYQRMKRIGEEIRWPERRQPMVGASRPGRNEPCLCGSGKKYKKCCGI